MAVTSSALRTVLAGGSTNGAAPEMVVELASDGSTIVDGEREQASLVAFAPPRARLVTQAGEHDVLILPLPDGSRSAAGVERVEVVVDGWRFEVDLEPEARARLRDRATRSGNERAKGGPVEVRAIIPGRILSVDVADGDAVEAGQRVLVVEAMKMQNEIRAPRAGTIRGVAVGGGQNVEHGDVLLVIE